jgi:Ca2+-binding RTX toxin-like protein
LQTPASNTGLAAGDAISNADAYILTEFGDTFIGLTSGQNIVFGYGGNDTLVGGFNANNWFFGGDGNDRMVGGGVADLFVGDSGADTIVPVTGTPIAGSSVFGFTPGTDTIEISRSAFGLSAGYAVTTGSTFAAGTSPANTVASPTFLYYTDLGLLYFDPDGTGSTSATLLMQIAGAPALAASDFHLV